MLHKNPLNFNRTIDIPVTLTLSCKKQWFHYRSKTYYFANAMIAEATHCTSEWRWDHTGISPVSYTVGL